MKDSDLKSPGWSLPGASRRQFLAGSTAATALLLAGCGSSSSSSGSTSNASKSLTVTIYGGTWQTAIMSSVIPAFEKATGAKVTPSIGTDSTWYTQLRAANGSNPPFDVTILEPQEIQGAIAEKLIMPLDTSKISNFSQVDPVLLTEPYAGVSFNNQVYAVPFAIGQHGLAYRTDKIKVKPTSILDLWNPAYKGHVALPPLPGSGNEATGFFDQLCKAMGGSVSQPAIVDKAFAKLTQLKPSVVAQPSDPTSEAAVLQQGDAWIMPYVDGLTYSLADQGVPVGFAYPTEGPVAGGAPWVIPTGTSNLDLAYKFIEATIDAEAQAKFSGVQIYAMSNMTTKYPANVANRVATGPTADKKLVWIDTAAVTQDLDQWGKRWAAIFG